MARRLFVVATLKLRKAWPGGDARRAAAQEAGKRPGVGLTPFAAPVDARRKGPPGRPLKTGTEHESPARQTDHDLNNRLLSDAAPGWVHGIGSPARQPSLG